jgi:hypothetical protein
MSFERQHTHEHASHHAAQQDDDLAPGRKAASSQLVASSTPIISALIQRKARDANGVAPDPESAVAAAATAQGSPLPTAVQRKFETSLGTDLSSVRVHTGSVSANAASAVGAKAYTVGQDIHFAAGHYDPSSVGGEHLLAHEVAHTVQQRGGSPTRQNKLEISTPHDPAEHEADRAADAMVSGVATSVSSASGLMREPDPNNPFGIGIFQPNQSKHGVAYDVPATDYKSSVVPNAPSMASEMPAGAIGDPGAIPGWKTMIPAQEKSLGPFKYTDPAREATITGEEHSNEIKEAWFDYKNQLIRGVSDAWDSGAKAKMNTYAQQAHGDPELETLVKDMRDTYHMENMGQRGKGTVSDQAGATNVCDGQTAPDIANQVAAKGDLKMDLEVTAKAGQNGTVEGPVGALITTLKTHHMLTVASVGSLGAAQHEMDAASHAMVAATAQIDIDDLNEKIDDEKKKKEEIENGQRTLKKIDPELARIVAMVQDNSAQLQTLTGMVKAAPGAMEGDVGSILETCKGLLEVSKWDELARIDNKIQMIADEVKSKYKLKNEQALLDARARITAATKNAAAKAGEVLARLLQERTDYQSLAQAVETNWRGKDKRDGKLAAQALRALPAVRKVIRTLLDIKATLPPLPDASTRASQGFTLATKGVGAPGAADLLKVAGWIAGSPKAIEPEIKKWTDINAQLEVVTAGLGLT